MNKSFRYKLTYILIAFALILSLIIIVFDYAKLKRSVKEGLETRILMAEDKIITSLASIDKVYNVTDEQSAEKMREYSYELVEKYKDNPNFDEWDFAALRELYGMDLYIIDQNNVVTHSSFEQDIGLDFTQCCPKFGELLSERKKTNEFFHDGLDLQQKTGEFKKFSYMPTPDHKYLIELGYLLEDDIVFQEFNFLDTIEELLAENDKITSIRVYNSIGLLLGDKNVETRTVDESRRPIFMEAFQEFETKEVKAHENGALVTYRYIPYKAENPRGLSTNRVVEIAYNDIEMTSVLNTYRNQFIFQTIAITFVVIILSFAIAKIVSRPVHLAFHDMLTGLKNRAAFEDLATEWFARKKDPLLFMMIDLDNFKTVNDQLGHDKGDQILKQAALIIEKKAGREHIAARIGGDEFVVLFADVTEEDAKRIADRMIKKMNQAFRDLQETEGIHLSISIGIASAGSNDTLHSLYKKADVALYESKNNGKNQYSVYTAMDNVLYY